MSVSDRMRGAAVNISRPFVTRPVATTLLSCGLLLAGIIAYFLLPVASLPEVDSPVRTSVRDVDITLLFAFLFRAARGKRVQRHGGFDCECALGKGAWLLPG